MSMLTGSFPSGCAVVSTSSLSTVSRWKVLRNSETKRMSAKTDMTTEMPAPPSVRTLRSSCVLFVE